MRKITAAWLGVLLLVTGCGGDDPSSTGTTAGTRSTVAPTTTIAATTTTRSAEALETSLLQPADVPGTTATPPGGDEADLSHCFPGNPVPDKTNPSRVDGPDLESIQGAVRYTYASSARVGTPGQARAFVTEFASPTGSSCAFEAFKARLAGPPFRWDPSDLTAKPSTVSIGDAGAQLTIIGNIKEEGKQFPLSVEFYLFHTGDVVVYVSAVAVNGSVPAGQGLELARKVADRLS